MFWTLFQERRDSINNTRLLSTPAISSPSTTSDSTDTIMSSPVNTRGSSYLGSTRLESLLFQHYKRNGDNISPDGDSKRRCMTSLGVREQESFNPVHQSEASEFTRLRPYSCPVICSEQAQVQPVDLVGLTSSSRSNQSSKSETWPVKLKCDKENKRDKSETQDNKVHFVQKPTVINGRINNLHNVVSCPDFQQLTKNIDSVSVQDVKSSRPSSNILNSLLSSDFDLSWRKSDALKPEAKSMISTPQSVTSSTSDLSSLTGPQLRMIADLSTSPESTVKLSNQSSRSAFVPVTSHKQLSNSILLEAKLTPQLPPVTVCKAPEVLQYASLSADLNCKSDSEIPSYTCSSFIPQTSSQSFSCLAPTPSVIFSKNLTDSIDVLTKESKALGSCGLETQQISNSVFLTPQSSSQSLVQKYQAASTPPLRSSPITRVNASTVASHVISTSSPVSSTSTAFVITPPPRNSTHPMVQQLLHLGGPVKTDLLLSGPKRSGIPITSIHDQTPSPPKKDSWPVSAILKEQRSINLAKGLLVNLGNNYQGEVKFQMPAELLCLAPDSSGVKAKENLHSKVNSSPAELKGHKDNKPQPSVDTDNLDKNLPNQKTMSLSSALLSELSQLVSSGQPP
ncbi:hypothetical protein Btru_041398 [Bulinus truncatus]|nr:hypothetical protein Btru_041398 [Bulinus truncatus]